MEPPTRDLDRVTATEIDTQITTARRYPRDVTTFANRCRQIALSTDAVAGACYYTLERTDHRTGKKKLIQGPSIRLAEIAASNWGNLRWGARVISDAGKWVTCQGVAHDLENNVFVSTEAMRPICTREGRRYSDDMISVTTNACLAIAQRNAVLRLVPRQIVDSIMQEAMDLIAATLKREKNLSGRWKRAVAWFGERGVSEEELLAYVNRTHADEITADDLVALNGIKTAIHDEATSLEEFFPRRDDAARERAAAAVHTDAEQSPAERAAAAVRGRRPKAKDSDAAPDEREPGAEG